jgi:hypothetical protein
MALILGHTRLDLPREDIMNQASIRPYVVQTAE